MSWLLGIKTCPRCGTTCRWGSLVCPECRQALEMSQSEVAFVLATNSGLRDLYWRYQELGAGEEFIQDLLHPVTL